MCVHHLKVDDNSVCLKRKKIFPMQIRKHKDEYIVSTECLGKDFSAGGDKFKLYIRLHSNNN